jgi:peroxiredoxin
MLRKIIIAALGATLLAGCDDAPSAAPTASAATAVPGPKSEPPKTEVRVKEYTEVPRSELGTLPEGIGLPPGTKLPRVTLKSADGKTFALNEPGRPLLLVFYRGGWCPFCNFQIRELTREHSKLAKRGVTLVAVSVDQVSEAAKTSASYEIPFPVLSDPDLQAHEALRVVHQASPGEIEKLKGVGMDIEQSSGKKHHKFAVPAVFIVDHAGVIRWAHANLDYKLRPSAAQLLEVIDGLDLKAP